MDVKTEVDIEPLLRLFADQTTEHAILLFDAAGTVIWCNPTSARVFGYACEDLIGATCNKLFTPEDIEQRVPEFEFSVARQSSDMSNDRWLVRCDGSRFWANGSTTALRNSAGELVGYCKILRNRTDMKEQLELLRNRAESLLKADAHKNVFLSTLSHELRNPLAPLVNAVQIIRTTTQDSGPLDYAVEVMDRQIAMLTRLIDDLLDVTRISAGKIELQIGEVELKRVLARALEGVQPASKERGQELVRHFLDAPIIVKGDERRLEQVFVNLLNNAVKYTGRQGRIEVRATLDKNEALVHVSDNGIGIPTEMQPHIFDLFTQVAKDGGDAEGLGIGLSVVKSIVELHGGSVQVRSDGRDKGSEFSVRLPLVQPRAGPDATGL